MVIQHCKRSGLHGFGDKQAKCKVYIGNIPNSALVPPAGQITGLARGDIAAIGQACGNGWRKVFNVYAKLYFAWQSRSPMLNQYSSWQAYRDDLLLHPGSNTALLFSQPDLTESGTLHLIMGKTYAKSLSLPDSLRWVNHEFAIDPSNHVIVCPYFDYRQLSNNKIIFLVDLLNSLAKTSN